MKLPSPLVQLRDLQKWSREFPRSWPQLVEGRPWDYWKIPVGQGLANPPHTRPGLQRACAQAMIDAAVRLAKVKPASAAHYRVMAILPFPELFGASITLSMDEEHHQDWIARPDWTPLPAHRDLAAEKGLRWPSHFQVRGFLAVYEAYEDMPETREEVWLVGELQD